MTLFSELWNGIKTAGAGLLQIVGVVAGALIDSVFWLIDRVFDAIEAIMDLVSWTFEQIGNWLSPKDNTGTVTLLPPTPQVIGLDSSSEYSSRTLSAFKGNSSNIILDQCFPNINVILLHQFFRVSNSHLIFSHAFIIFSLVSGLIHLIFCFHKLRYSDNQSGKDSTPNSSSSAFSSLVL